MFLRAKSILSDIRLEVEVDVATVDRAANDAADDDAQEDHSELPDVETVDANIYERECFEVRIVNAVYERCVHVGEENSRVAEENLRGLDHLFRNDFSERGIALVNFALASQVVATCQLAQSFGSSQQNIRG